MGEGMMLAGPWSDLGWLAGMFVLLGVAAVHDRTAKPSAPRVPVRPVLIEGWRFIGRYWRRAPGPALLSIPVLVGAVMTFLKQQGFLGLLGLVGFFLLMGMAVGAAVRLGRQEIEPNRADLELGPLGIQFGVVERKVLGAMLLLIGLGLAFQLAIGLIGWMLRLAGGLPLMVVFTFLSVCATIYVYGRLMLLVPRAGFGRGASLAETWRLTRAALFPLAAVAFIPQILTTPLSLLVQWIAPNRLAGTPFGLADGVVLLIYLVISPFGWGAQIAMLRVLEPAAPEA